MLNLSILENYGRICSKIISGGDYNEAKIYQ